MSQNIYDDDQFFTGYAQLGRSIHGLEGAPEWPALKQLLPNLRDLNLADLGCGYGWFCRFAHDQGAAYITGYDLSEKMLNQARRMTVNDSIDYVCADLEALNLPESFYDLIYSSLTLHYIEHISELFKNIYEALKDNGRFIFSVEHPIYTASIASPDWIISQDGQKSWPINNYQKEGFRSRDWISKGVVKQHRTIGTYLNLLIHQGFTISHVEEWGPTDEQVTIIPELAEERERPMLLLVSVHR